MSIQFHAVMLDETGCEFGATIIAANKEDAYETAREHYPESRCVQMESPADTAAREKRIYDAALLDEGDWDFDYDEDEEYEYEDDEDGWCGTCMENAEQCRC
jgi:hypothetical protein